jgi:hypothetical protein
MAARRSQQSQSQLRRSVFRVSLIFTNYRLQQRSSLTAIMRAIVVPVTLDLTIFT